MKNIVLSLLYILSITSFASAQDFKFGEHTSAELSMTRYDKDTSAHAVVLKEYGKASIDSRNGNKLIFEYHVKIKLFDKRAFDKADVSLKTFRLFDNHVGSEIQSRNIKATTYYLDNNGVEQHADLDTEKIYYQKVDSDREVVKFSLPAVQNGCIIEYQYKTTFFNTLRSFHTWHFQSDIPKLYSEYQTDIPKIMSYNVTLRGPLELSSRTSEIERFCFNIPGALVDCVNTTYVMQNIPAFIEEDYMTARYNFESALYFSLSQYLNEEGEVKNFGLTWTDVDHVLQKEEQFGGQLKRKSLLKDKLPQAILNITDTLDKAKAIFGYLQNWFKWNKYVGIYSTKDGIKKPLESHAGSVADINFSLINALNSVGIKADAVILSTRNNGLVNMLYPTIADFNYLIARAYIGNKAYFLDASDKLLPFGMLPLNCINGKGRVINLTAPSYWVDLVAEQKLNKTTVLDLTLSKTGKVNGTVTIYSLDYAAYQKRKQISNFNSVDEYVENLDEKLVRVKILKSTIENLDSLNLPLTEQYEIEITPKNNFNSDKVSFNPSFWSHFETNPFKLSERTYPVDMYSASNEKILVTVRYPNNFEIADKPSSTALMLPDKGGRFATSLQVSPGIFTYSQTHQMDKALYSAREYPYLKEFYNKIIQAQKADIVFKIAP